MWGNKNQPLCKGIRCIPAAALERPEGMSGRLVEWQEDAALFERWARGQASRAVVGELAIAKPLFFMAPAAGGLRALLSRMHFLLPRLQTGLCLWMHAVFSCQAACASSVHASQTGLPFVDASMRELAATGWMSNRGRQNVASLLSKVGQLLMRCQALCFGMPCHAAPTHQTQQNWQHSCLASALPHSHPSGIAAGLAPGRRAVCQPAGRSRLDAQYHKLGVQFW